MLTPAARAAFPIRTRWFVSIANYRAPIWDEATRTTAAMWPRKGGEQWSTRLGTCSGGREAPIRVGVERSEPGEVRGRGRVQARVDSRRDRRVVEAVLRGGGERAASPAKVRGGDRG